MFGLHGTGVGILRSEEIINAGLQSDLRNSPSHKTVNKQPRNRWNGVSAQKLLIPIIAVLVILHALIIYLIISINSTSGVLSATMQRSGAYTSDATSLLASTSMMSETSSNYILLPTLEDGSANIGPLVAYTEALDSDDRGDSVSARFREYEVSPQIVGLMDEAAACHNEMVENQLHAIALVSSVYPLPAIPPLAGLTLPELTKEEKAYSNEEKLAAGRYLILGEKQGANKSTVSENVNSVIGMIQGASQEMSMATGQKLMVLRVIMWVVTLTIILILAVTFIMLYRQLVSPLGKFVKLIAKDSPLDERKGMKEVRLVADAYNKLLERRDALDTILRSAAETDTLTNLPNRYSFQQFILDLAKEPSSVAVFLFDVNYLKQTNDTQGHSAGDQMLRNAADCIAQCFDMAQEGACFRIGGDEFAAIIRGHNEIEIVRMLAKFDKLQEERKVSISYGYEYTDSMEQTTVKELLDQADQNMYKHKKRVHGEHGQI